MQTHYLDPNRPPPTLLGAGLDAIVDKPGRRRYPIAPTPKARKQRYDDAVATAGASEEDHGRRAVHGVELQENLRAYGTTIDLRLVALAEMRMELAQRAAALATAKTWHGAVHVLRGRNRG